MIIEYYTIDELIDALKRIDKRRTKHSPYVSRIEYNYNGEYIVTLTNSKHGGSVKKILLKKEGEDAKISN